MTFAPGPGQTQTISDNIADESGNGGAIVGTIGQWGITLAGAGTLNLSGANTYSGSTAVEWDVAGVQRQCTLGSGNLIVDSGATLEINNGNMIAPLANR